LALAFQGIVSDTSTMRFQGRTADAFQDIVKESADVLDDMPQVCGDVAWVLAEHARAVRQLHQEADAALARARTAWHDQRRSSTAANDASGRAEHIRRQIRSLQGYPPEQVSSQMQRLHYNLSIEQRAASNHKWNAETAARRLNQEYQNRDGYERREESINRHTAQALRNLDLRSLKDPSLWEQFRAGLDHFLSDPEAFINEWIDRSLLWLREALDVVMDVVTFVAFALAIAALFVPGLQFIVLGVALIGLGLSLAKLGSTLALAERGVINPESGRAFGETELWEGAIDVGLATLSVVSAGFATVLPAKPLPRGTISVSKAIASEGARSLLSNSPGMIVDGMRGKLGWSSISEISGAVHTVSAVDDVARVTNPAYSVVSREIERVRSNDRRASRAVVCHLLPVGSGTR
jgi:hypothetical protein